MLHEMTGSQMFASSKQGQAVREDFLEEVILERLADFGQRQRKRKSVSGERNSMNKHQEAGKMKLNWPFSFVL